MPVLGLRQVLKYRGRLRYFIKNGEHYGQILARYQDSHPDAEPFTGPELATVQEFVLLMGQKLAAKTGV